MTCIERIKSIMGNGKYHALAALAKGTGYGETTISATIRKLRADGYQVTMKRDKRARGFSYRLSSDRLIVPETLTRRKCICTGCHGRGFKYGGVIK